MSRIFYLLAMMAAYPAWGQELTVSGNVYDREGPLAYVAVSLHRAGDSSMVSGTLTDTTGGFVMEGLTKGAYLLRTSFVGYQDRWMSLQMNTRPWHMDSILLVNDASGLDEVVVEGKRSIVEIGVDRKAYDVQETMGTPGGSAIDVLSQIPSVGVDQEGNISLRGGSNVNILINGRPTAAEGSSVSAVLEGIPASSVQRIEVIPNPYAKYDPDGMSGIINIVLKKDSRKGNTIFTQISVANSHNYSGALTYDYRKGKWVVNANYSMRHYEGYRNFEQDRTSYFGDTLTLLEQSRQGTDFNHTQLLGFGFEHMPKEGHVWGMNASGNINLRRRTGDLVNTESDGQGETFRNWTRATEDPRSRLRTMAGAFYEAKWKSQKLNVDLSQSYNSANSQGHYREYYFDPLWIPTGEAALLEEQTSSSDEWVTTAMLDHAWTLSDNMKLETGLKSILKDVSRTFQTSEFDHDLGDYTRNDSLTDDYRYKEGIHAAYGTFSQGFKKGFSYMAGLRAEMAFTNFDLRSQGGEFKNDYYSLFPSLHLSQKIGKKQELSLSYSRRVNRPGVRQMNPVPRYTDPLNLMVGNPRLTPEYINSVELGYSFFNKFITLSPSAYFKHMQDMLTRMKTIDSSGVTAVTWTNLEEGLNYGLEIVAIVKPTKWWNMMLSGNVYHSILLDDGGGNVDLNNQGMNWFVKYNSTWTFWEDLDVTVSGEYNGRRVTPQGYILPRYHTDIWIKKGFLGGRGSFGFRVEDVFDTKSFRLQLDDEIFDQTTLYKWQSRRFHLTFSLRFGDAVEKKRKGSGGSGGDGGDGGF